MCHFPLKALSQNGLFHQPSRRGALRLWQGFSIPDKEQSCPSRAAPASSHYGRADKRQLAEKHVYGPAKKCPRGKKVSRSRPSPLFCLFFLLLHLLVIFPRCHKAVAIESSLSETLAYKSFTYKYMARRKLSRALLSV